MAGMKGIVTGPFHGHHLPDAGLLLADRHRRHRLTQPLLSSRYEDPQLAQEMISAAFEDGASGAVAARDGTLVGFLVGSLKSSPIWGPNIWVESAGHATAQGEEEALRSMYAVAAERWVAEGRTAHFALVPADDPDLVRTWFRLGFGHQHTHAVRTLPDMPLPSPAGLRRAERRDISMLAQLDDVLDRHQQASPTFAAGGPPSLMELEAEQEEDFDDPDFTSFVIEHRGQVVGTAVGCAVEKSSTNSGLLLPEHAGFLGFAAVLPSARGIGLGQALGNAVAAWAAEEGFTSLATDWREPNLHASRTWRSIGYRDTFIRVHRLLGH